MEEFGVEGGFSFQLIAFNTQDFEHFYPAICKQLCN